MKDDQASSTAYTVLQGILFSASKPDYQPLIPAEMQQACRKILSASAEGKKRLSQLDSRLYRSFAPVMENAMMPGITLHYVLRKRYIRDAVEAAIEEGFTQIVNLGAGFDTLAWELHQQHAGVNFIELDHPATNAQKAKALFELSPDNLHLLAVDFSETDAKGALEGFSGFDPERRTFYICEGVLMYLDQPDVERLFSGLKQLTGSGTRFVFTCVVPMTSPDNNCGWLLKLYLKIKGEPLNWMIEQKELPQFLQQQSYQLHDLAGTEQLKQRYLKDINHGVLHQGEFLVLSSAND
ncbi:class I SAM-dependent methyltransferase [Oceanospirillum beijerinckii]|uniref:class I SAM-dependent methyltransferase n=1 Tax=Oceanospirillum beijerinckii TaxID=64976 RepID=UPI0003F5FCF5|nr:SAM-dependent methyltransferase [Oceanospirillum beijerinckii]MAC47045.1 SAM-dependent methyltransferase [Oceanospirillum sp.]